MSNFRRNVFPLSLSDLAKSVEWRLRWLYTRTVYRLYGQCLYWLTYMHRRTLHQTVFIGVTGSAGKSTTKDLVASILERHLTRGRKVPGSANGPRDVAYLVLGTRRLDEYCVAEIATSGPGSVDLPLALCRPTVGVVTNIGADHFSAFKSRDAIAQEKGKLIRSLPPDGIAILNADDPRVLAMRSQFPGRTVTFGLSGDAMLRGDAIQSIWPDRLSLTATWNGESVHVQTQLCGMHWAPTVLAALATGVALGVPLTVAAEAVASVEPFEGRMAPVAMDGITFIRDDWKAPLSSIEPAFEFMRQANATRKVIVVGTISDCQGDATRRYVEVGQQALAVADSVVFVGTRASAALRAKRDAKDELRAFPSLRDAATYLSGYLRPGDLVLLKGSTRPDHLERLILTRTIGVDCWRSNCGYMEFCNSCDSLHVASGPECTEVAARAGLEEGKTIRLGAGSSIVNRPTVVVVGLGNPGDRYLATPHNVGQCVVDVMAQRLAENWICEGDLAMVVRAHVEGLPICLIKLLTPMNHSGPTLRRLAQEIGFGVGECILVYDDLDLPIGTVRARMRGGDGGHQGVQSIVQAFQDDKFRRIKIGVGRPAPGTPVIDYVLTPFSTGQRATIDAACRTAADRVIELVRQASTSKRSKLTEE